MTLVALLVGVARLPDPNPFADLSVDATQREKSLKWNAVVWGLLQAMEGLIIFACAPPVLHLLAAPQMHFVIQCNGIGPPRSEYSPSGHRIQDCMRTPRKRCAGTY